MSPYLVFNALTAVDHTGHLAPAREPSLVWLDDISDVSSHPSFREWSVASLRRTGKLAVAHRPSVVFDALKANRTAVNGPQRPEAPKLPVHLFSDGKTYYDRPQPNVLDTTSCILFEPVTIVAGHFRFPLGSKITALNTLFSPLQDSRILTVQETTEELVALLRVLNHPCVDIRPKPLTPRPT